MNRYTCYYQNSPEKKSKKKYPVRYYLIGYTLNSGQPYEIFPALFYLPDNPTMVEVVERGTHG